MRRTDEANTDERRRQIVEAAVRCFDRLGLHGASNSVICKEAGISPGHLYYYFENREALIQAVFSHSWVLGRGYLDALVDTPHGLSVYLDLIAPPPELERPEEVARHMAFVLDILAEVGRNPAIAKVHKAHRKQFLAKLTQMVEAARARGELAARADVEVVVYAVDMIAAARDVNVAALRHDQQAYALNTRKLLKGLIKVPG
jgi:TetR/AcrR family transcriptional repressor of uid operon